MVTLDRRKLAAPVAAQAVAFAVVLVIGIFTGHTTKTPAPGPTHSASPGARASTPAAGPSSPAAAKGEGGGGKLTVTVAEQTAGGLSVAGSQVQVLRDGTSVVIASGILNTARQFAMNLPPGKYEVCVNPVGWISVGPGTHLIHGFICSAATVGSAPQSVTFHVVPKTTQAAA